MNALVSFLVFSQIFFAFAQANAEVPDVIARYCQEDNSSAGKLNDLMYRDCIKRNVKAVREIKHLRDNHKGQFWLEHIAGPNCLEQNTKRDLVNYFMVADCLKDERDGFLELQFAMQKKTEEADFIRYCLINNMASKYAFRFAKLCLKDATPAARVKARSFIAEMPKNIPANWREPLNSIILGGSSGPPGLTARKMANLPDVSNFPDEEKKIERRDSPSLLEKAKRLIGSALTESANNSKTAPNGCDAEKTKAAFLSACEAALLYNAKSSGQVPSTAQERERCRCVAVNLAVENVPDAPSCDFPNFQIVYAVLNSDKARLACN